MYVDVTALDCSQGVIDTVTANDTVIVIDPRALQRLVPP